MFLVVEIVVRFEVTLAVQRLMGYIGHFLYGLPGNQPSEHSYNGGRTRSIGGVFLQIVLSRASRVDSLKGNRDNSDEIATDFEETYLLQSKA